VEVCGRLFDVDSNRKEILVDKACDLIVGVRFGFQPNTSASSGSGAEVQQNCFNAGLCLLQRSIRVFDPLHGHNLFPLSLKILRHISQILEFVTGLKNRAARGPPCFTRDSCEIVDVSIFHISIFRRHGRRVGSRSGRIASAGMLHLQVIHHLIAGSVGLCNSLQLWKSSLAAAVHIKKKGGRQAALHRSRSIVSFSEESRVKQVKRSHCRSPSGDPLLSFRQHWILRSAWQFSSGLCWPRFRSAQLYRRSHSRRC
jgi:hypothetical protein